MADTTDVGLSYIVDNPTQMIADTPLVDSAETVTGQSIVNQPTDSPDIPTSLPVSASPSPAVDLPPLPDLELKRICNGMRFLSLFNGTARPDDGLEFFLGEFGASLDAYDVSIDASHDLLDDHYWSEILERVTAGHYNGGGGGAPCSTFSPGRNYRDGGPRPVRGEWPPELFGLPELTPEEKQAVSEGTLLALRKAEMLASLHTQGFPG